MKKLAILIFICFALNLNAQITLDKSFTPANSGGGVFDYMIYNVTENLPYSKTVNYIIHHKGENTMRIYNLDYSLKSVFTITPPTNYDFSSIQCASKKLFNSDEEVEILITYILRLEEGVQGSAHYTILYNENGKIIKDFENAWIVRAFVANNQFKLITNDFSTVYTGYPNHYMDHNISIYTLGGPLTTVDNSSKTSYNSPPPFPNPANSIINLPYDLKDSEISTMSIYNSNGHFIEQKQIDSFFDSIRLNVMDYEPGIYFYQYDGVSNKFIVQ